MPLIKGKQIATGSDGIKAVNVDTNEVPTLASGGTFTGSIVASSTLSIADFPTLGGHAANKDYVDQEAANLAVVPTISNKAMAALATTADGNLACNTGLAGTPTGDGFVTVSVNGLRAEVALNEAARTSSECYFSRSAAPYSDGAQAVTLSQVVAGDKLYWNGSVAGYQLSTSDRISFHYHD
jgi:hypothetical protein